MMNTQTSTDAFRQAAEGMVARQGKGASNSPPMRMLTEVERLVQGEVG